MIESRLDQIIAICPAVIYALRPTDANAGYLISYLSGNAERLTGYTAEQWGSNPNFWQDHLHPDDKANALAAQQVLFEQGQLRHQYRFLHSDGRYRWIDDQLTLIRDQQGQVQEIIGTWLDITDQKTAEFQLAESEQRWKFAIDGSDLGLWDWNIATNQVFFSPRWKTMLGFCENEISNDLSEWESRVHPEDKPKVKLDVQRHFDGETTYYANEHRVRCKDGSYKWILDRGQIVARSDNGKPTRMIGTHTDLTEYKRGQEAMELNTRLFEQSAEGIIICDPDQRIVTVNRAFSEITGYTADEVIGKNPKILQSGRHDRDFYRNMWAMLERTGRWQGEIWNRRKDGEIYPEWISVNACYNREGSITHFFGIFSDITQHKLAEEHISYLVHYDALTDLPNRALLEERVNQATAQARREKETFALLYLDLDRFNLVNDSLGHSIGDQLLIEVGKRLKQQIREEDSVSRLGGDEFALLLLNARTQGAAHVAAKVVQALSEPFCINGHELSVTPSMGIAIYPIDGQDYESLLQCADAAMYRAKKSGRNDFRFYTAEMHLHANRTLQLENALRRAVERNELLLHYQPQLDITTQQIVGCEALLRWRHAEFGLISPADFIPIAEESGLILSIGEWVLRTAVEQTKAWQQAGLPPLVMAVNLSALQFRQPHFLQQVLQILDESRLDARFLELELTESIMMDDPQTAISVMDRLRRHGIKLSIDDFGTGYSSLSYLKRFNINKLKIDQSFVRDLTNDPDSAAIASAVISLAKSLGLRTIAEGVETPEQLQLLQDKGCDEIQGYFLARPLPANEFIDILCRR